MREWKLKHRETERPIAAKTSCAQMVYSESVLQPSPAMAYAESVLQPSPGMPESVGQPWEKSALNSRTLKGFGSFALAGTTLTGF